MKANFIVFCIFFNFIPITLWSSEDSCHIHLNSNHSVTELSKLDFKWREFTFSSEYNLLLTGGYLNFFSLRIGFGLRDVKSGQIITLHNPLKRVRFHEGHHLILLSEMLPDGTRFRLSLSVVQTHRREVVPLKLNLTKLKIDFEGQSVGNLDSVELDAESLVFLKEHTTEIYHIDRLGFWDSHSYIIED